MESVDEWIERTQVISRLTEYVKQKSRSNHGEEVAACANYAKNILEGLDLAVELIPTSGNPLVLAEKHADQPKKTLLIYGHYDVQPEGDLDLWDSPPFEPEVRDGKLWGRGSADNKGQHFAHFMALEYFREKFPEKFGELDVRFILDGDEERGSFSLAEVFEAYKSRLDADIMIVSDGPSLVTDKPTIVGSVRGILTFQITIKHNPEDLHSGNFGGMARSATQDLVHLLTDMFDDTGRCLIPGFYDDVTPPSELELSLIGKLQGVLEAIGDERGYARATVQEGKDNGYQNQFWPTFNINGISAGGVKKERRTIIPAEAVASVDCRLVPNMRSDVIKKLIGDFIDDWGRKHNCLEGISVDFEHAMESLSSSLNNENLGLVQEALEAGFGTEAVLVPRLGGSLPLYLFPEYLGKDVFLVPYALPDENNHAP
ncbi:MAG: M20/M25/M40 family metallo-hydrolase, partial [Candidatus Kariarchaeaceae archaeon]